MKNLNQLCIDLGSSKYILAAKLGSGGYAVNIDLKGNTVTKKQENVACIQMQDAMNPEHIDSSQVSFGKPQDEKKFSNVAMMLNWKNYFFEATHSAIKYPSTPTIPSHNNRSARVWLSTLFEAFFCRSLIALST